MERIAWFLSTVPIAKVFTMCFLGFLMASNYVNILPARGRKLLNGLVFSLLLPCFIFSQLGQAITIRKMLQWWLIPINIVLGSVSDSLIGLLVASIAISIHCIILGYLLVLSGHGSSKLGIRTTAAIIFGRLLLLPPTGLAIVMLADKPGFLPTGDKMFRFVLLLQHTIPTSVLSGCLLSV